jgi:hypothetical protein
MVRPGIVRQINYQSVLYLYPVVPCGVESSQLKLLTLKYKRTNNDLQNIHLKLKIK